jgi:hypothetical protein
MLEDKSAGMSGDNEIVRALRCCGVYDYDKNCGECPVCTTEKVCCSELMPKAADLIDSLTAQLTESQRLEKAEAKLIRKIYFTTDECLCDSCWNIVRMIEAWNDEEGEHKEVKGGDI